MEDLEVVIVGAGICGLATALAIHRKGIESVVLERSESLRAYGGAIGLLTNGWVALDSLGVGSKLRQASLPLQGVRDIWVDSNKQRAGALSKGEARCVKRSDLINTLAQDLPPTTIRFGSQILSIQEDHFTNFHILQLHNGSSLKAKILIGCDGASSVVAQYLKLKPRKIFPACAIRGLTYYPTSHGFAPEFVRMHGNNVVCGRSTIAENLVFWFVLLPGFSPQDSEIFKEPESIKRVAQQKIRTSNFPKEVNEMIEHCDTASISLTRLTYKPAWHALLGTFQKGTATVAGDAMHLMGPFLGQGGSAALEDAVVLARCLAPAVHCQRRLGGGGWRRVEEALDGYLRERRMRLAGLSAQTYLTGLLLSSSSPAVKLLLIVLITVLFRGVAHHTRYDCGRL